jgi:hypothetical protein
MSIVVLTEFVNIFVAIVLVIRLMSQQLLSAYKIFATFLLFDLSASVLSVSVPWEALYRQYGVDYRVVWLIERPIDWLLYVWVVYAILQKVMKDHPGIFQASQRMLWGCFAAAVLIALLSARLELAVTQSGQVALIGTLVKRALVIERACVTTSLLLLATTLTFLLWFPVQVTRNAALLCSGLLAYFGSEIAMLLLLDVWGVGSSKFFSVGLNLVHTACLVLWLLYLNVRGEQRKVRPGHSWRRKDQDRLIGQLEAINAALARSGRR